MTKENEDCISRKAVDRIINKWLSNPYYELKDNIYDMTKKIHNLPSVIPQRPKGKWIEIEIDAGEFIYKCTECGMRVINLYKYCPNCGSYNGGGENDREKER